MEDGRSKLDDRWNVSVLTFQSINFHLQSCSYDDI
jgi:hypothetical protein